MRRMVSLALGLLIGLPPGAAVSYWMIDRNGPTDLISMKVISPVYAGRAMKVQYQVNRRRSCPREVERTITDSSGMTIKLGEQEAPVFNEAGYYEYVQTIRVPEMVQPGHGVYRVQIKDRCNPLHRWFPILTERSIGITVVAP